MYHVSAPGAGCLECGNCGGFFNAANLGCFSSRDKHTPSANEQIHRYYTIMCVTVLSQYRYWHVTYCNYMPNVA